MPAARPLKVKTVPMVPTIIQWRAASAIAEQPANLL
jgi:hypothetical protein